MASELTIANEVLLALVASSMMGAFAGFIVQSVKLGIYWWILMFVYFAVESGNDLLLMFMWGIVLVLLFVVAFRGYQWAFINSRGM